MSANGKYGKSGGKDENRIRDLQGNMDGRAGAYRIKSRRASRHINAIAVDKFEKRKSSQILLYKLVRLI